MKKTVQSIVAIVAKIILGMALVVIVPSQTTVQAAGQLTAQEGMHDGGLHGAADAKKTPPERAAMLKVTLIRTKEYVDAYNTAYADAYAKTVNAGIFGAGLERP